MGPIKSGFAILALTALAVLGPFPAAVPVSTQPEGASSDYPPVGFAMRNVHFRLAAGVSVDVRELRGRMVSRSRSQPPVLDDSQSYTLHVSTGEASITTESLTRLFNDHLFAYEDAPLRDVKVETEGNQLKLSGKLKKGLEVPFSLVSDVSISPDGRLLLHTDKVKAVGIPAKGLMDLFDLEVDELVSLEKVRGVTAKENDVLLDPGRVLPPPAIQGRLGTVRVEGNRVIQTFVSEEGRDGISGAPGEGNYVFFRGGVIRFGKLTMTDADLVLIDTDPSDPFDFYPEKYIQQLVAGYSKSLPDGGLRSYMPDFDQAGDKNKDNGTAQAE